MSSPARMLFDLLYAACWAKSNLHNSGYFSRRGKRMGKYGWAIVAVLFFAAIVLLVSNGLGFAQIADDLEEFVFALAAQLRL
jgi:hypothetical protein